MNDSIGALCFLLSKTENDLLVDDCFKKNVFVIPEPLQIYTGLSLGEHFVNAYLASHGLFLANCVPTHNSFEELTQIIASNPKLLGQKIAINLFENPPLVIKPTTSKNFEILWSHDDKNPVGKIISTENHDESLVEPFSALTIESQVSVLNKPDFEVSIQSAKEFYQSFFFLYLEGKEDKTRIVKNLNNFLTDVRQIGKANSNEELLDATKEAETMLKSDQTFGCLIPPFVDLRNQMKLVLELLLGKKIEELRVSNEDANPQGH